MSAHPQQLVAPDDWTVEQHGFDPVRNRVYESLFSLGNGNFGGRGNHEEQYSGDSLRGNYVGGIYYPDPTRVGWWKNGYPDYFAKVLNSADWKPIHVTADGAPLDLATATTDDFVRVLHMRTGELHRSFTATLPNGRRLRIEAERFISMVRIRLGVVRYRITPLDDHAATGDHDVATDGESGAARRDVEIGLSLHVDGDVMNEDSNYDAGFWEEVDQSVAGLRTVVRARTRKTGFVVATAADADLSIDGVPITPDVRIETRSRFAAANVTVPVAVGQTLEIVKYGAIASSRLSEESALLDKVGAVLDDALATGFRRLLDEHRAAWDAKWAIADVIIDGDPAAQQGIRFNIFNLFSTFTGDDPDLNIGPKGFTGEKYGGVTYWDTEAFCLPFYLATARPHVAKNLLRYRHRQLGKAIENAEKLGFSDGAALFPMVTINGEECHNEWEITFEEIHRNGAIAFAIFDYIRFTGDRRHLLEGGLEVLVAIARFWVQRVSWSDQRNQWVMLGVTGPNEYENNVDNNWYTCLMAQWTLRYATEAIAIARSIDATTTERVLAAVDFDEANEVERWADVADNIHLGEDADRGIFLQQTNFLDKQLLTVDDLDPAERPINQHWSWDRILRSVYIKQADVLQGLWVLNDRFDLDTLRRNFEFYEPRTVHESSLSPSVHAVLAVRLGLLDKAHEMLLRTARLDLDDVNGDTDDGCHTTSMAGTWLAAVQGFGGMRVVAGALHLDPVLAPGWTRLAFEVQFRGATVAVEATADTLHIENSGSNSAPLVVRGESLDLAGGATLTR